MRNANEKESSSEVINDGYNWKYILYFAIRSAWIESNIKWLMTSQTERVTQIFDARC